MEGTTGYFERFELFQNKEQQPGGTAATALASVSSRVDDWYGSFWDIALKYCDGDLRAAEHMMDCGVFMFFYRLKQKAAWLKWKNEQAAQ